MNVPKMTPESVIPGLREVEVTSLGKAPEVLVRDAGAWEQQPYAAVWAATARPSIGCRALLAEGVEGRYFVVGVVAGDWSTDRPEAAGDDVVRVHSPRGELVFEYDPAAERGRVWLHAAQVELAATGESLTLSAPDVLDLRARHVRMEGRETTSLSAGQTSKSSMRVDPRGIALEGAACEMDFDRTELRSDRLGVRGKTFEGKFDRTRVVAERVETIAHEMTARARRAYQFVEDCIQTRAGRVRQIVKGAFLTRSEKVAIQARNDVKVQGRQIKLG